ncbi:FIG00003370: Multicopper polyphenol oxidase [hydrothermal vent metagenome]|uniref:FIG00003370: Multicopper polyphenol oxidase n=1 Tax=hydrothermal vent metagenome TaxID=652676 RepID=A0A3B0ZWL6_9ZZZZ
MSLKKNLPQIIIPNWVVSEKIQALSTTRKGGSSRSPYDELNLATHVNDNSEDVKQNRRRLTQHSSLPAEPSWLEQIHSDKVVRLTPQNYQQAFIADASYTTDKNIVCCVMTADCVPVLVCNKQSTWVAAVHAGWKGIANGILKKTLQIYSEKMAGDLADIHVWIGPAISGKAYEVGQEVKEAFIQQDAILEKAFTRQDTSHYLLDSSYAVQLQCVQQGVSTKQISTENFCTYQDSKRFYSYRRDGIHTGRMASMVWLS